MSEGGIDVVRVLHRRRRREVDLLAAVAMDGQALHGMVSQMIAEQPRGRR
jgi:hypothetical protein